VSSEYSRTITNNDQYSIYILSDNCSSSIGRKLAVREVCLLLRCVLTCNLENFLNITSKRPNEDASKEENKRKFRKYNDST